MAYDPIKGYDASLDYSATIEQYRAQGRDTTQLEKERAAKINDPDGKYKGNEPNMYNSNQTYTQASNNRTGTSTSSGGTTMSNQQAISNAIGTATKVTGYDYSPYAATDAYTQSVNRQQTGGQQPAAPDYSQYAAPTWGSSVELKKGPGYVTGGYTIGVNGTAILNDNPYWKGGKMQPDMSRRPDLAGKTAVSNGYTVYYDENGYATKAAKGVTDYLPTQDFYVKTGQYKGGNLWTDEEMLSAADLRAIEEIRAGIASGKYTGDQANQLANQIRAGYGYTIDKNGNVTNSGVVTTINDRRQKFGMSVMPETTEQGYYRYLWNTDTSPVAQASGAVKSYADYAAGEPSTDKIGAPVIGPGNSVQNNVNVGGNSAMDLPMSGGGNVSGGVNIGGGVGSISGGTFGDYLDEWFNASQQQQTNTIDYATNQAILELLRQQQDAQATFQDQQNQIALDEAIAKDNQALYAESRGDKGGIGAAQYDSIMNTAAQNRLAVSQAQQKLSTDTARQIADLRAQGEYEKADALLSISQTYLSQLINLEQWAMEYNLSVAQFYASLEQWEAEFKLAVSDVTGYYNGTPTLGYQQYQNELALTQQSQLASAGETLLAAGIMPSASQLSAMGITQEQAQSYITAAQLAAAQRATGSGSGGGGGGGETSMNLTTAKVYAENGIFNDDVIAAFKKNDWDDSLIIAEYPAYQDSMQYMKDYDVTNRMSGDGTKIYVSGMGYIDPSEISTGMESGIIVAEPDHKNKTVTYSYNKKYKD